MDVVAAFVADAQTAVLVEPGDCSLDDPAVFAEPGAVLALWPGDLRADAAGPEIAAGLA